MMIAILVLVYHGGLSGVAREMESLDQAKLTSFWEAECNKGSCRGGD